METASFSGMVIICVSAPGRGMENSRKASGNQIRRTALQPWISSRPAISTGIYGYPLEEATLIAVSAVRGFVAGQQSLVERVIFACFDDTTLDVYRRCGVAVEERIAY